MSYVILSNSDKFPVHCLSGQKHLTPKEARLLNRGTMIYTSMERGYIISLTEALGLRAEGLGVIAIRPRGYSNKA